MEEPETLEEIMSTKSVGNVSGSSQFCGLTEELTGTLCSFEVNVGENFQGTDGKNGSFDAGDAGFGKAAVVGDGEGLGATEDIVVGFEANFSCDNDGVDGFPEAEVGVEAGSGIKMVGLTSEVRGEAAIDTVVGAKKVKEMDFAKKVEVSSDNLALYVDFSSSLSGNVDIENCPLFYKNEKFKEPHADEEEHLISRFHVGDAVWVRTMDQSWWPGKIYDPVDASKYGLDEDRKNCLLVGYLGISHAAFCSPSQLKPLHENFDEIITSQTETRSFLGAVERAVDEFSKCLKSEISSFIKYNQVSDDDAGIPEETSMQAGRFGKFSVSLFEPVSFLAQLKYLGEVVVKPSVLDLAALKSWYSAFIDSLGHSQLHIDQLYEAGSAAEMVESESEDDWQPTKKMKGDKTLKQQKSSNVDKCSRNSLVSCSTKRKRKKNSEIENEVLDAPSLEDWDGSLGLSMTMRKSSRMRERKRSKYLSYPYVDLETKELVQNASEGETGSIVASQRNGCGSGFVCKLSGETFKKEWYEKLIKRNDLANNPEFIDASAKDLLSELCLTAADCLYSSDKENFDLIEWFFSKFRLSAYHDDAFHEMCSENDIMNDADGLVEEDGEESTQSVLHTNPTLKMQKNKPKTSAGSNSTSLSGLSKSSRGQRKKQRKKKVRAEGLETDQITGLPDLNCHGVVPNMSTGAAMTPNAPSEAERMPNEGKKDGAKVSPSATSEGETMSNEGMKDGAGTVAVELQVTDPFSVNAVHSESNDKFTNKLENLGDNQTMPGMSGKVPPTVCAISAEGKSGHRKQNRKDMPTSEQTGDSHLPDLNGTASEPSLSSKSEKKRKRKGEVPLGRPRKAPTSLTSETRTTKSEDGSPGAALALTFVAGASIPSKDVLVATFSKFGALAESQTQRSEEYTSAQIVFLRSTDAAEAFRSLEKANPFGETLLNYQLHLLSGSLSAQPMTQSGAPSKPVASAQNPVKTPPIDFIRKNLELMTAMLEKSGATLSSEMRANLEAEIKGLLNKVSSMPNSQLM